MSEFSLLDMSNMKTTWARPASFCLRPQRVASTSPRGYRFVKCGSRIWSYCSHCASRYQWDQHNVIGSGCLPGFVDEGVLSGYRFYALTLSAPSFGRVHTKDGKCACGLMHLPNEGIIGTPVNLTTYKHRFQVEWNANVNDLMRYSMKYFTDKVPVDWVAAREWQRRGTIHAHFIFRVPRDMSVKMVEREIKKIKTYRYGEYRWGKSLHLEEIPADRMSSTVNYLTKSLGKNARQQSGKYGILSDEIMEHYAMLDDAATRVRCNKKEKCLLSKCKAKSHKSFGWNGHVISMTAGWSLDNTTLKSIREERADWVKNCSTESQQDFEKRLEDTYNKMNHDFKDDTFTVKLIDTDRANRLLDFFEDISI